jgi:hypothetical protein
MRDFGSFRRSSTGIMSIEIVVVVIIVYFGDGRELAMRS